MKKKITLFNEGNLPPKKFVEIFQGGTAYAACADSHNLTKKILKEIKKLSKILLSGAAS